MKTGRKRKAILSGQRPERRHASKFLPSKRSVLTALAILSSLATAAYLAPKLANNVALMSIWQGSLTKKSPLRVVFGKGSSDHLRPEQKTEIAGAIGRLPNLSYHQLSTTARNILQAHNAREVSLSHQGLGLVHVETFFHVPRLRVQVDRIRLISDLGAIYGQPQSDLEHSLPFVSGVFERKDSDYRFTEDGVLIAKPDEALLVREAIDLEDATRNRNQTPISIAFNSFRGFTVVLSNTGIEVLFGRFPFGERPTRLVSILDKLKAKGMSASRIELDFDGKAFVKEKPL